MGIIILLEAIALIVCLPFLAYSLAKKDLFFTFLNTGNIKYIMHGDNLHRIIADVKGKVVNQNTHEMEPGTPNKPSFGLYWVGLPPFASVHTFKIKKEHENPTGATSTEWIKGGETEVVSSLRETFPRPFVLTKVELGDRQTVDLLMSTKWEVVDTYTPVFKLKGDFFTNAGSILRAAIVDILKRQTDMEAFLAMDKGEDSGQLKDLKSPSGEFNRIVKEQTGLHLVGISIPQWDPSDPTVRDAMQLQFIAQKEAEATVIAAEAHAKKVTTEAEGDATAAERLARARGARVRETLEAMASRGGSPDELVRAAADILRAEAQPNLTTLVEGGSTQAVVVGGSK